MPLDVTVLSPTNTQRTRATFRVRVRCADGHDGWCFGIFIAERNAPSERPERTTATHLATMCENIAGMSDLPARADQWFSAFVRHIHESMEREGSGIANVSACIGFAWQDDGRTTIALAAAGAVAGIIMRTSAHGAPSMRDIVTPQPIPDRLAFRNALEGAITTRDTLVIGPASTTDAIPRAMLTRACTGANRASGMATLATAIAAERSALILVAPEATASPPIHPQASMRAFIATAASTERFLTPTLGPMLREWWSQAVGTLALLRARRASARGSRRTVRVLPFAVSAIRLTFRTVALALRSIGSVLLDALRIARTGAVRALRTLRTRRPSRHEARRTPIAERIRATSPRAIAQRVANAPLSAARTLQRVYRALPRTSRTLLVLTIFLAVLFSGSTFALWRQRSAGTAVGSYDSTIAAMDELRAVAEAKLLFGDTEGAREALRSALDALGTLPRTTRARRERAAALERELTASLDRARLLVRVTQPVTVARGNERGLFAAIADITLVGRTLIVVSSDGTQFATVDPRTGATAVRPLSAVTMRNPRAFARDDRTFFAIDMAGTIVAVDISTGEVTPLAIASPPPAISNAAVFRGRLYLLHPDGAITRHDRTASGFGRGSVWLSHDRGLTDPKHLLVAGSVFVSSESGEVAVYAGGQRQSTALLRDVDPPLHRAATLSTDADADTLFVGDPELGRVIALQTNGALVGQVQSDTFRGLTRIVLDAGNAAVYVLHNHTVSVVVPPKPNT